MSRPSSSHVSVHGSFTVNSFHAWLLFQTKLNMNVCRCKRICMHMHANVFDCICNILSFVSSFKTRGVAEYLGT